jgi:flagellar motility protein MotE (MotC chaperone)
MKENETPLKEIDNLNERLKGLVDLAKSRTNDLNNALQAQ